MTKYNIEIKKKLIELIEKKHHSISSAARELSVNNYLARRWVKMYQAHGYEGLVMKSKTYTGAFKINAIEYMHKNHLSLNEASAKLGIPSRTTLANWERIYYEEGADGLLMDRRGRPRKDMNEKSKNNLKKDIPKETKEDLIAEIQRLKAENAYLKKYNALVQEKKNLKTRKKQR